MFAFLYQFFYTINFIFLHQILKFRKRNWCKKAKNWFRRFGVRNWCKKAKNWFRRFGVRNWCKKAKNSLKNLV